jgi:Domain of unknown function (DUF1735)
LTIEIATVNLDADQPSSEDVKVTMVQNPSLVADWNADPDNNFLDELPVNVYTIPTYVLTITKGSRLASLKMTIPNAQLLDVNLAYGVGLSIASNDKGIKIADNLRNVLVSISAKNEFDGIYELKGKLFHPTNASLVGPFFFPSASGFPNTIPNPVYLITAGPKSVNLGIANGPGISIAQPLFVNGAPWSFFSGVNPRFTVSPTNEIVVGKALSGSVDFTIPAGITNSYNPSTRTFMASMNWIGGGGDRQVWDTLRYLRPR